MQQSNRLKLVKPSATIKMTTIANQLKAEGHDIVGLSSGEPDFDTPQFIKDAAIEAIQRGDTKYTPAQGSTALLQAIANKLKRDNNLEYSTTDICVTSGAKQACFNLCMALLNPKDEAIIPAPYWVSYPDMVSMCEAVPVPILCPITDHFKLKPDALRVAITERTRLLFLNSPSNPSGAVYSLEELKALAAVLMEYPDIAILTDDIYEHIILDGQPFYNIINAEPALAKRTVVINGVSKAYAMTGWRIGYAAGPSDMINNIKTIQGQSTSNACSIAQAAAVAALNGDQSCLNEMLTAFKRRSKLVYDGINAIPGLTTLLSAGSFYNFIHVEEAMRKKNISSDTAFTEALLSECQIAAVAGSSFGLAGYIRISFATSDDNINKALERLAHYLTA